MREQGRELTGVLEFQAPIEEIVGRFSGRRVCPVDGSTYHIDTQPPLQAGLCDICHTQLVRRADDEPEVVQRRLEVYTEKTAPLIDYYRQRGMLYHVDATRSRNGFRAYPEGDRKRLKASPTQPVGSRKRRL